jgi:outer membrane protein TolC
MTVLASVALALALAQAPGAPSAATAPADPTPPPSAISPDRPVLALDDALARAAEANLDLRAARARLDQARQGVWKAWSGHLPQVTLGASYTHNNTGASISLPTGFNVRDVGAPQGPPPNDPSRPVSPENPPGSPTNLLVFPAGIAEATIQEQDQYGLQVEANQALVAPQLWYAIRAAYLGSDVADATVEGVRRDILFGVAQAYYGVASLRRAVEVNERLLEIAQRQERDARVRYQAGTVAKVALLRAEIDRARAEQDVLRARNAYASAKISLATLLDRETDFEVTDPPEPRATGDLAALEGAALRERTDVRAAALQEELARAQRRGTQARYLPSLGAFGRWQYSNVEGFSGEKDSWAVGLGLSWTLLDGGLREAELRESSARLREAEASRASTRSRAVAEVRQAVLDLESARANAVKAREQRDLAAENQRLVDVAFRAGTATAVEQADAVATLRTAEIAVTTETLNAQLAALRVLQAAGEFEPVARR